MAGAEGIEPSAYGFGGLHGRTRKRLITLKISRFFSVLDADRCFAITIDITGFSWHEKMPLQKDRRSVFAIFLRFKFHQIEGLQILFDNPNKIIGVFRVFQFAYIQALDARRFSWSQTSFRLAGFSMS